MLGDRLRLLRSTGQLELFGQDDSLPVIYAATSVVFRDNLSSPGALLEAAHSVSKDRGLSLCPRPSLAGRGSIPRRRLRGCVTILPNFTELLRCMVSQSLCFRNPMTRIGSFSSVGTQLVTRITTWQTGLRMHGRKGDGTLSWRLEYRLQEPVTAGGLVGLALLLLAIAVTGLDLWIRKARPVARQVFRSRKQAGYERVGSPGSIPLRENDEVAARRG